MDVAIPSHPSTADLEAFGLGELPPEQARAVESHVAACDSCCEALQHVPDDVLVDRLRQAFTGPAVPAAAGATVGLEEGDVPEALREHPRYRVLRLLGRGGMGAVYLAEHRVLRRLVALKVINREYVANAAAVERFRREARAAARLHHPHIVAALDADQAGETHFLVLEYVEGTSLDRLLTERGPLPVAEACTYARQAALGLQHAHECGMVHRDVKPHNLMRTPEGTVKVLDFGLAAVADEGGAAALTRERAVMGTPDYIAPEQAEDARAADARADVYSLGCTLYQLLTGRVPFPAETAMQKLLAHRHEKAQPIRAVRSDVPAALGAVVEKMMARTPAGRYQTAAEAAEALEPFAAGRPPKPPRSRRRLLLAAAALFAVAVAAVAVIVHIKTEKGEVTIQTDDPNIELVVTRGGKLVRIIDPKSGQKWELDPEKYQLGLADSADGLTIDLDGRQPFVLKRKGEKLVTIARGSPEKPKEEKPNEVTSESPLREYKWPDVRVTALVIRPHGEGLVGVGKPVTRGDSSKEKEEKSGGSLIRVWDRSGKVSYEGQSNRDVAQALVTRDGTRLLTGSEAHVDLWDLEEKRHLFGETLSVWNRMEKLGGFSRDGQRFCVIWRGNKVSVHKTSSCALLSHIEVNAGQLTPDGKRVFIVMVPDRAIGFYEVEGGKTTNVVKVDPWLRSETALLLPDGRTVVAAVDTERRTNSEWGFWDVTTGKQIRSVRVRLAGRRAVVSPDGRWLLGEDARDSMLHLFDLSDGKELGRPIKLGGEKDVFAFAPDGRTFAVASEGRGISLYRVPTTPKDALPADLHTDWKVVRLAREKGGWEAFINRGSADKVTPGMRFAVHGLDEDGKPLARDKALLEVTEVVAAHLSRARVIHVEGRHDPDNDPVLADDVLAGPLPAEAKGPQEVRHHDWPRVVNSTAVAFTPDGRAYLTTGDVKGEKTRLCLWDVESGKLLREITVPPGVVQSVAFTPDGKRLLIAHSAQSADEQTIRLLDVEDGHQIRWMDSPAPYVELTGFSADGKRFCLFRVEPTHAICIYETQTFKEVGRFRDLKDAKKPLQGGQLTADRKLVLVVTPETGAFCSFHFYYLGTLKEVRAFEVVNRLPCDWGAVFLTDGSRTMVTFGGSHRHWCYWDIASGNVRREVRIAPWCSHTRVSPDGRWLLGVPEGSDSLAVFEMEHGQEVTRFKLPTRGLSHAFSPDGRYFVVGTADKGFYLYRLPDVPEKMTAEQLRSRMQMAASDRKQAMQEIEKASLIDMNDPLAVREQRMRYRRLLQKAILEYSALRAALDRPENRGVLPPDEEVQVRFSEAELWFYDGGERKRYEEALELYSQLASRYAGTIDGVSALGGSLRCYAALGEKEKVEQFAAEIRKALKNVDESLRKPWEEWLQTVARPSP